MNKNLTFAPKAFLALVLTCAAMTSLTACGSKFQTPAIDETGQEGARPVDPGDNNGSETPVDSPETPIENVPSSRVALTQAMNVRKDVSGILEFASEIPDGAIVEVPENHEVRHLDYRASDGTLARSSTGFLRPVKLISVPSSHSANFPASKIAELNKVSGGLHISASIISDIEGSEGNFTALKAATPSSEFLLNYEASGKPKFSYITSVKKRFGDRLNQGVDPATQSAADRKKFQKVYSELALAGNRSVETPRALLMIDVAKAKQASIDYETDGSVLPNGAWTVAVQGTAVRHGFPNVPCAEFMSEVIRQAYKRAGYKHTDEFNSANSSKLIWNETAAVRGLSQALYNAGWVPWDPAVYRPMTGALLMHGSGNSPGHTFMAAGDDGRFIIDNGSPQGRDLRKTTDKTIKLMYLNGVFFLPPGINPKKW
ncbi:MAG TPA: hypothetical protein VM432_01265 [Bdellovibrionales bacterium]|nr:hypothetical protein [Bdellovibrionales bacterium]